MQTYILFEKVRGVWVKLGKYDDPTTLARMAYHLGCLHGTKPTEIKVETIDNMTEQLASAPQWVSVKERLPECDDGCEIGNVEWISNGSIYAGCFGRGGRLRDAYFRTWTDSTEGIDAKDADAWRIPVFPEPPKEGASE